MKAIAAVIVVSICLASLGSQKPAQSVQPEGIEVSLSTEKKQYRPGETIHVRVEIKNVSDHTVLVGRELSTVSNWPFSIWLRLVDSTGMYAQPVYGAYLDPPPKPDLSLRAGVLRWWTVLDPACFYGRDIDFQLQSVKAGHYELRGDYYSSGLAHPVKAVPEGSPDRKNTPAFAGKIETRPLPIEILKSE